MTHFRPLQLLLLATLLWSAIEVRGQEAAPIVRTNFLWITVEDMSPQLGCYGDDTVPTPNVDGLAEEGIRFTRAFAPYGVCAPNRSALITGMYPTSIGAMHMRTMTRTSAIDQVTDPEMLAIPTYEAVPPPAVKCFTEYLRAAGYYCSNNSKEDYQFATPLTAWDDSSGSAHWRNRPSTNTPFFAVFNFTVTHESKVFEETSPQVADPEEVPVPPYYADTPTVRRDIARNYDNIAEMDRQVGRLLDELKADGLMESTVIFYFSDHGAGLPRAKRWVYDSGIQVPLIVRFPGALRAGTVNEDLVSFVDFAPTMLSLSGLAIPAHLEGQAFLGPKKASPRKYIFAFRDRMDPAMERIRAVRDSRFKYIYNYRPDLPYIGFIPYRDRMALMQEMLSLMEAGELGPDQWQFWAQHKPVEELYDTETDPHEIHNLAADPQHLEKLGELREIHQAFVKKYGDLGSLSETNLIKRLWPPDGVQPVTESPTIIVDPTETEGTYRLQLESPTKGASIAYRLDDEERWKLYSRPVRIKAGTKLATKAVRIGFKPSEVIERTIR